MYGEEIEIQRVEEFTFPIYIGSQAMTVEQEIMGQTFTFIHPENIDFWGLGGLSFFFNGLKENQRFKKIPLANGETLECDERGEAICPMISFSKSQLEADKKNLMAHIMLELRIFKSVGEAKRNGWDKPIELGEFCVTKKKIKFEVRE